MWLISDACARVIASQWHSGNVSASFSTTGAITDPGEVYTELFTLRGRPVEFETAADREAADMLRDYLDANGSRGPVPGWSGLWL